MTNTPLTPTDPQQRPPWVWDYNITWAQFQAMLDGTFRLGRLDRDWAAVRLIEYAPYEEMIRLLGYSGLVEGWPRWRERMRAHDQQEALDFVVEWAQTHHPELLRNE